MPPQKSLATTTDRDELLSSSGSPHVTLEMERTGSPSSSSQAQRARMLSATDKLADGQRRLQESYSVALETERVGSTILGDLRGQRDQLVHTRDNVSFVDDSKSTRGNG